MDKMQHTPTPWEAWPIPNDHLGRYAVVCVNGEHCPGAGKEVVADKIRTEATARRIVACVNACEGLATEYLETVGLPEFAGKMLCADLAQQELERVTAQRDQLLAALEKYEAAFDSLFGQCCSNPIRNAWGEEVNLSLLNEAHHAAGPAIAAARGGK